MSIPTRVMAAQGMVVLLEDIPGKSRLKIRPGQVVNLLEHYTLEEIRGSAGLQTSLVEGWLVGGGGVEEQEPSVKSKTDISIPEGKLVSKTYQNVEIQPSKTGRGAVETVMDPKDVSAIREKVAGMAASKSVEDDTSDVGEEADPEADENLSVSQFEKKKTAEAKKRLKRKPKIITKGSSRARKKPVFSISAFVEATEVEKIAMIEDGKIKDVNNLKAIKSKKINKNGTFFSVRVRKAAGDMVAELEE